MLKIRLRRMGSRHRPFYRVVVSDSRRTPRASALEEVGYYDPRKTPATLSMNVERIDYWMSNGALPSSTVSKLVAKARTETPAGDAAEAAVTEAEAGEVAEAAAVETAADTEADAVETAADTEAAAIEIAADTEATAVETAADTEAAGAEGDSEDAEGGSPEDASGGDENADTKSADAPEEGQTS